MSGNKLVDLLNEYNHTHTVLETEQILNIKPVTTGQMKAILQYEGEEDSILIDQILDDVINGCVTTEGFDVNTLTLQDRFELLIGIRKVSKGNVYNFNIKCPKCNSESIQAVELDKLEVVPYPTDIERKVPVSDNLILTLDFVRRGHQIESVELAEKLAEKLGVKFNDNQRFSEIATFMYAFGITDVNTKVASVKDITVEDKKEFLDNLSSNAYDKINKWYEDNNYGTKFVYTVKCKAGSCDFTQQEDIPITGFFF